MLLQDPGCPALGVDDDGTATFVDDAESTFAAVDTNETGNELVGWVGEDFGWGADLGYDTAFLEDDDLVTKEQSFFDVVGDEDDCRFEFVMDSEEFGLQVRAHKWIGCAEGFVHEGNVRVVGEGSGHPNPLPLPTGELAWPSAS